MKIVRRALEEPLRQIVANAGAEPSVVIEKVQRGSGSFGYNAANGTYGDLIEMGVVDVIQVDINHVGGISALWKVAAMAQVAGITMAPHACEGPIGGIATLHVDYGRAGEGTVTATLEVDSNDPGGTRSATQAGTAVAGTVYKWVDPQGQVHYTDRPPRASGSRRARSGRLP